SLSPMTRLTCRRSSVAYVVTPDTSGGTQSTMFETPTRESVSEFCSSLLVIGRARVVECFEVDVRVKNDVEGLGSCHVDLFVLADVDDDFGREVAGAPA
ncbi:hypothetical protein, partial [Okibacterium endophyticum]